LPLLLETDIQPTKLQIILRFKKIKPHADVIGPTEHKIKNKTKNCSSHLPFPLYYASKQTHSRPQGVGEKNMWIVFTY